MDEQQEQAVLDVEQLEEIETDTNYDYLSILREMQHSLGADEDSSAVYQGIADAQDATVAPTVEADLDSATENGLPANSYFAITEAEKELTADYFADAPTQPLPELPNDFNHDLMFDSSLVVDETTAITEETNDSNGNSSASEWETAPAIDEAGLGGQSFADSTNNDFDELSPILFDANEFGEIAEPDFAADLATGELPTLTPEELRESSPRNLPDEMSDEMPTSLAFGEMLVEDQSETSISFAPPIESEAEINAEPDPGFVSSPETFDEKTDYATSAALLAEPHSDEQDVFSSENSVAANPTELAAENGGTLSFEDSLDFALPDEMMFAQGESDLAPEPSFAMLDAENESANSSRDISSSSNEESLTETWTESATATELNEVQRCEEDAADDLNLPFPTFLRADLAAHSGGGAEEFSPEPSFETGGFADEDAPTETSAASENLLTALPPLAENGHLGEMPLNDRTASTERVSDTVFDEYISADETTEMPETFFSESLSAEFAEPGDFAADELPAELSSEMPENLLLNDVATNPPEADFSEFDAPPPFPAFDEVDLQFSEPPLDLALAAPPSPNSVTQNASSLLSNMADTASFLKERFIIFKLDDTLYAFSAANITEIGQLLPITPLPFVPSWFLGISNLRGEILSVVGLRELWKKNTAPPQKTKILILHSNKHHLTVGLVVDAVREMRHVVPEEIFSDESHTESHFAPYQIGMIKYEGQNLCLLDAEKMLDTLRS